MLQNNTAENGAFSSANNYGSRGGSRFETAASPTVKCKSHHICNKPSEISSLFLALLPLSEHY